MLKIRNPMKNEYRYFPLCKVLRKTSSKCKKKATHTHTAAKFCYFSIRPSTRNLKGEWMHFNHMPYHVRNAISLKFWLALRLVHFAWACELFTHLTRLYSSLNNDVACKLKRDDEGLGFTCVSQRQHCVIFLLICNKHWVWPNTGRGLLNPIVNLIVIMQKSWN